MQDYQMEQKNILPVILTKFCKILIVVILFQSCKTEVFDGYEEYKKNALSKLNGIDLIMNSFKTDTSLMQSSSYICDTAYSIYSSNQQLLNNNRICEKFKDLGIKEVVRFKSGTIHIVLKRIKANQAYGIYIIEDLSGDSKEVKTNKLVVEKLSGSPYYLHAEVD